MTTAEMIAKERARLVSDEGFDQELVDKYASGEIGCIAAAYLMAAVWQTSCPDQDLPADTPPMWPESWSPNIWWKPSKDPVRNLVKAGAFIAAEIERTERARNTSQQA